MQTFTTVVLWIFGSLFALYLFVSEFIDTIGRMEWVQEHWPRVWRAMSNRPFRIVLLIFLVVLVGKDVSERMHDEERIQPLEVTIPAPAAPIVQFLVSNPAPAPYQAPAATQPIVVVTADYPLKTLRDDLKKAKLDLEQLSKDDMEERERFMKEICPNPCMLRPGIPPERFFPQHHAAEVAILEKYKNLVLPKIANARNEYLAYIKTSVTPLTPKQLSDDENQFETSNQRAMEISDKSTDPTDFGTNHFQKFNAMITYITNLLTSLRDN